MSSFIDLMGKDRWTEIDIRNRTESMVRSEFSSDAEQILNRKVTGQIMGAYAMTLAEQAELGRLQVVLMAARLAGEAAYADMLLLNAAMAHEAAEARYNAPTLDVPAMVLDESGSEMINPAIIADATERAAAKAVIDGATQAVLDLVALRNPPEPLPEPTPEVMNK